MSQAEDDSKTVNDLIIRDGFPALLMPPSKRYQQERQDDKTKTSTKKKQQQQQWWVDETDETMKVPVHNFWSHDNAIKFNSSRSLETMVRDCQRVFTARTLDRNASYSAGTTYFLPALAKPRCALEGLVQTIFNQHVSLLGKEEYYKPTESGAEWWTLVLGGDNDDINNDNNKNTINNGNEEDEEEDEEDEVGWHFDADYGLEDQAPGLLLHPRVATVTYLSNTGAPTVVLDCKTPAQGNVLKLHNQRIDKAWISYPKIGKHAAFDGRLLHGAPAAVFPSRESLLSNKSKENNNNDTDEPPVKRPKTELYFSKPSPRITLLVNIWLNHCPLDAALLDEDIVAQMESPWNIEKDSNGSFSNTTTTGAVGSTQKCHEQQQQQPNPLFTWSQDVRIEDKPNLESVAIVTAPPPAAAASKPDDEEENDDEEEDFEDDVVICNHHVTIHYGGLTKDYHGVLKESTFLSTNNDNAKAASSSLEVDLGHGALTVFVGEPLSSDVEEKEEA